MSTVALIQLSAQVPASSDDAIDLAAERIDSVRSADLIVLPEVWYPGYFSFDSYVAAASQTPSMMERFSDIARSAATCLHVGSLIEADGDRHFNTSVMFGPDGQVIGRYRKMHLFGYGSREQELLTPGS
ncbi:MAG: nitrilase-related carbon-nitrogen hydrolase, partial [Ilumatobacteraceae bacterium]